jgi:uncharacterized protein DUF6077
VAARAAGVIDTAPAPTAAPPRDPIATVCDRVLDVTVVAFALWTVAYHVALWRHFTVDRTGGVWLVLAIVAAVGVWRLRPRERDAVDVVPVPRAAMVSAGIGVVAALVAGTWVLDDWRWWPFAAVAVVAVLLGLASVLRGRRVAAPAFASVPVAGLVVLLIGALFAVAALVIVRPDADDVVLVNRSVWVEQHGGQFPQRDTLFTNERLRSVRAEDPSPAIEPFIGLVARWTPLSAPSAAYLLVSPFVAFLGALALWRFVRALRARLPVIAVALAALYLAFGGSFHTSFGNFSFARAWQGKVIFLFVVVPLLWRHAIAWARDDDRGALALLVAGNVAAVGLTSTALFVAPPITVLGVVAGLRRDRAPIQLGGMLLALAYPLGAALFALVVDPQPKVALLAAGAHFVAQVGQQPPVDYTTGLSPGEPWYVVIGTGAVATIAGIGVFCGWLGVRERTARLALLLAPLGLLAGFLAPHVLHLLDAFSQGESVLWRAVWIVPVPALVGLLPGAIAVEDRNGRIGRGAVAVVAALVLVVAGAPIWAKRNGSVVDWRPQWDVAAADLRAASHLLSMSRPRDMVLAPESISAAIAIQNVDVKTINPRLRYMSGRAAIRSFHRNERLLMSFSVQNGLDPASTGAFVASLKLLGVDTVCTRPALDGTDVTNALQAAGFRSLGTDQQCHYWTRR